MSKNTLVANESERAVLGSILINPTVIDEVRPILEGPEAFAQPMHQEVYAAMVALHDARKPIDSTALMDWLVSHKKLEASGGVGYVGALVDAVSTSAHAIRYAHEVKDRYTLRKAVSLCGEVQRMAERGESSQAVLEAAERGLFALSSGQALDGEVAVHDALDQAVADIDAILRKDHDAVGVTTGLRDLDAIIGGLRNAEMVTLAGKTGLGKTALALHVARHAAKLGVGVLYLSMEMDRSELVRRLIQAEGKVYMTGLEKGFLAKQERAKVEVAVPALRGLPIHIVDTPKQTTWSIRSAARRFRTKHERMLIVIDYLQLTAQSGKPKAMREHLTEVSAGVKELAREVNCPVLSLAQLSREGIKNAANGYQLMHYLKETGSIEQDSDLVITLAPLGEEDKNRDAPRINVAVTVAKNRRGRIGDVAVVFDRTIQRYVNLTGAPAPERSTRPKEPPRGDYGDVFEDEWTGAEEEAPF